MAMATVPLAYDYYPMAAVVATSDADDDDALRRRQPALALVHGMTSAAATFAEVVQPLTAVAHVFAVDLRGHGRSSEPAAAAGDDDDAAQYLEAFSIAAMARDVARFIQAVVFGEKGIALDLGSVHVLGHSWGARVASALALDPATAPLVRSVIIEDGAIATRGLPIGQRTPSEAARKVRSVAAKWQTTFATAAEAQAFCNAAMDDATDYSRKIEPLAPAAENDADENASCSCRLLFKPHAALAWNFHACSFDCTALWTSTSHCPLLVVAAQRGAFDTKTRKRFLADVGDATMQDANRRRRFVVVPGSGHSVHRTHPAEFVNLVSSFIGGL